jgi:tetratricopeptide (TPR) repeat protein
MLRPRPQSRGPGATASSGTSSRLTWRAAAPPRLAVPLARARSTRIRSIMFAHTAKKCARSLAGLGHAYAVSGDKDEACKVLEKLKEICTQRYVAPYNVAVIYSRLGDKDAAFDWLDRAFNERSYLLGVYLNTDSRLDNLRSDPRFRELHRKMNLP